MVDFNLPGKVILADIEAAIQIPQTFKKVVDSEKPGDLNQTIDILMNPLRNVQSRKYTKTNKTNDDNYIFDNVVFEYEHVQLDDETYAAVKVDGWDTLVINRENIRDYSDFFQYQANLISTDLEVSSAATLSAAKTARTLTVEGTYAQQGDSILSAIIILGSEFTTKGIPTEGRFLAVGTDVAARIVSAPNLLNAEKSANGGQTLRDSIIGRIGTFDIYTTASLAGNVMVAYHRDAFGVVSRAPGKNVSAPYSELIGDSSNVINLRANVLGLGARNATGFHVGTFFTTADLDSTNRAVKYTVTFTAAS